MGSTPNSFRFLDRFTDWDPAISWLVDPFLPLYFLRNIGIQSVPGRDFIPGVSLFLLGRIPSSFSHRIWVCLFMGLPDMLFSWQVLLVLMMGQSSIKYFWTFFLVCLDSSRLI